MFRARKGDSAVLNVHNDLGQPDIDASLDQLAAELPNVGSVSLVVCWFGDDLRCDECSLRPAVEQAVEDGDPMPWVVSGQRAAARGVVSRVDGRPVFGGTPADASVLQAIAKLKASGRAVMFYPFLLMDIQAGNGLADPWSGAADQPAVPWRGRITLGKAPGQAGSSDKTRRRPRRWRRSSARRRSGISRCRATPSTITGRKSGRTGGSSCTTRISAQRRAASRPSASARSCAG